MNKILVYLQTAAKCCLEGFELDLIGKELIGEALRLSGETGAELYGIAILGSRTGKNRDFLSEKTGDNTEKSAERLEENGERNAKIILKNEKRNAERLGENGGKNAEIVFKNVWEDAERLFSGDFLSDIRGLKELRVYQDESFDGFDALIYAKTLKAYADEIAPDAVLVGGTPEGRAVAPAVAAMLKTGATADCCDLKWDGRELLQIRPAFGGTMLAEISTPFSRPSVATVGAGFLKKYQAETRGECERIIGLQGGEKVMITGLQKDKKTMIAGLQNGEKERGENKKTIVVFCKPGEEILSSRRLEKRAIGGCDEFVEREIVLSRSLEKSGVIDGGKFAESGIISSRSLKERAAAVDGAEFGESEIVLSRSWEKNGAVGGEKFGEKEIVVAVGGGVKNHDDLEIFYGLCEKIGASLMCSRVVSERGFLTRTRQIGLSGRTVRPKLLLTFGVSGSAEFLAGIGAAEYIVAVNIDGNAPIMKIADEAIVGDMYEIAKEIIGLKP